MDNKLLKNFIKFTSLNVMGMIGLSCYILADTFYIANKMGTMGLAALNLSIPIYSFISGIGLMIGIGSATKFTILKASNNDSDANSFFSHSVISGLFIGGIFSVIGIVASETLSSLLGATGNTFAMTNIYLKTLLMFSPVFIINNIMIAFVRNDGNPKLAMMAMILGSFSNIILDYIFIFPFNMGMFGAAIATSIAPIISLLVLSVHFIKKQNSFSFYKCKIELEKIKIIFSLGVSAMITEISAGIILIIFNLIILKIAGDVAIAAYGIVANLALIIMAIFTGIAQGIQPILSKSFGSSKFDDLKQILKYSVITTSVIAVLVYLGGYIFTEQLINIFNKEGSKELAIIAREGIHIYFIGFIFAGINIILASYYSATNKPRYAFIISITRCGIAIIPTVYILSKLLEMAGVWMSFPVAEGITLIIGFICLIHEKNNYFYLKFNENIKKS